MTIIRSGAGLSLGGYEEKNGSRRSFAMSPYAGGRSISRNQQEKFAPTQSLTAPAQRPIMQDLEDRRYCQGPVGMGRIYPWLKVNAARDAEILQVGLLSKPIHSERPTRSCLRD